MATDITLVDSNTNDTTIHIKVDSDHIQKNEQFGAHFLEQMIVNTYHGAIVTKSTNKYGLLTDIWIKFQDPTDAIHFKLSRYHN